MFSMDFSFKNIGQKNCLYFDNIKHGNLNWIRRISLLLPRSFGLLYLVLLRHFLYFYLSDMFLNLMKLL